VDGCAGDGGISGVRKGRKPPVIDCAGHRPVCQNTGDPVFAESLHEDREQERNQKNKQHNVNGMDEGGMHNAALIFVLAAAVLPLAEIVDVPLRLVTVFCQTEKLVEGKSAQGAWVRFSNRDRPVCPSSTKTPGSNCVRSSWRAPRGVPSACRTRPKYS